jgi:hypothetical protein
MVERVALVKLQPEHATPEARRALAAEALATLRPLPGVLEVTAGVPADDDSLRSWDVCVVVRFASLADAEAYRAHPAHRRFVDAVIAPRAAARKGWTFAVERR